MRSSWILARFILLCYVRKSRAVLEYNIDNTNNTTISTLILTCLAKLIIDTHWHLIGFTYIHM